MGPSKLEQQILEKISPDSADNEKIDRLNNEIQTNVLEIADELGLKDVSPTLVGSVAKDTHLKTVDLDIFIMFPPGTSREELEKNGLKIASRILPEADEMYAEHPYLRGEIEGIQIDLVPCYDIKDSSQKMSAVDRTPFHTRYVKEHLPGELKQDVRLFKQFLKGTGTYGAEIKVQGFSGYLTEILVIEYGGFHNVLSKVQKWLLPGETIIPAEVADGFDRATLGKFIEPLIFIDPVDVTRNVASPVSMDTIQKLQKAAAAYQESPSKKFFFPKKPDAMRPAELEGRLEDPSMQVIGIDIRTNKILPDVLYSQVRKSLKAAETVLERAEFSVERSNFYVDENFDGDEDIRIFLIMLLDTYRLPDNQVHRGPPVGHANEESFKSKWTGSKDTLKGPYEKNKRWFVDIRREYTEAVDLVRNQFTGLNHGKQLNEFIQDGRFAIMAGPEMAKDEYAQELTEFILNKNPWEY
jgi:tRNA nucleotidyltransferase (CCA-adding enzyme)